MPQIKLTYGIPRNNTIDSLPLSDWTIVNTNTISVNGDTITQLGIAGWYESMYVSFTVPETKKYEISYDYNITTAQVGDHGTYGFGLWLTSNNPNVSGDAQASFYNNSDNRHGSIIGSKSEVLTGKSGTKKFSITLNANTTYYLWYPGAALEDGVTQTLSFTNIKISDVNYDFNNTLILPNQTDHLEYNIPSGTYTDILFQSTGVGEHTGTLAHSIYDYDMIKIYPRSVTSECGIQTMYAPKDIYSAGRNHVSTVFGGGNLYISDSYIKWLDGGNAFSANGINNGTYAGIRQVTNSVSGVTTKFERNSNYSNDNARIHMIVGTKYYGNRDLLFSANDSNISLPQTVNLSQPFTAYDRLQVKIKYRWDITEPDNFEMAGYWTEYFGYITTGACKLNFIGGNGGACYLYSFFGGWDNAQTLKINGAKPLVWAVNANNAVGVSPNYSANYYVSEVWGVK